MRRVLRKAISAFLATVLCAGITIVPVTASEAENEFAAAEEVTLSGDGIGEVTEDFEEEADLPSENDGEGAEEPTADSIDAEEDFEFFLEEETFDIEDAEEGVTEEATEESAEVEAKLEIEAETEPKSEEALDEDEPVVISIEILEENAEILELETEEFAETEAEEEKETAEVDDTVSEQYESETEDVTEPETESNEFASVDLNAKAVTAAGETEYTYRIVPLLAPFNKMLYVETDDPRDIYLADHDSVYNNGSGTSPYYLKWHRRYDDVVYEDEKTLRVHGGYIFKLMNGDSDGGTLMIQTGKSVRRTTESGQTYSSWEYFDTGVEIECPRLISAAQYLVDTYTDESMGFFEKMSATQQGLQELSLYPVTVKNESAPNEAKPYPCVWLVDYYKDQNWVEDSYLHMYENSDGLLLECMYPFVVDSLGFPGLMRRVAQYLDPSCLVTSSSVSHADINVTKDGVTKTYGGQGQGGPVMFISSEKLFSFTGDDGDYAFRMTLEKCGGKYAQYREIGSAQEAEYQSLMGDYKKDGKGKWLRISRTGTSRSFYMYFANFAEQENGSRVCDAWVDGRYVDNHGVCLADSDAPPMYEEHPTASILLHDQDYTNSQGERLHGDVLYSYFDSIDAWAAPAAYFKYLGDNKYAREYEMQKLPAGFILSKEQVNIMKGTLDANYDQVPASGLIYDGTELPGTPFENASLQSIYFDADTVVTSAYTHYISLPVRFNPASAFEQDFTITVDTTDIHVEMTRSYGVSIANLLVLSKTKPGSYNVTVTTADGKHNATCTIVVQAPMEKIRLSSYEYEFSGNQIRPTVIVEDSEGKVLTDKSDYTVEYANNVNPGIATVTVTGAGIYHGELTQSFQILLPFTDVNRWNHYYFYITDVFNRGLMTGMDAHTFAPNKELNRAFMAAVMYRRAGYPDQLFDNVFPDVKKDDWFAASALWARATNNIYGYENGNFGPTDTLTREQLCTILWRYAETTDGFDNSARADISKYPDSDKVSDFAKDAVSWCVAEGVFVPRSGRIDAWEAATRGELAAMLSRYLKAVGK